MWGWLTFPLHSCKSTWKVKNSAHEIGRENGQTNGPNRSQENVSEIHTDRERRVSSLRRTAEGTVRNIDWSFSILEKVEQTANQMGIRSEPI